MLQFSLCQGKVGPTQNGLNTDVRVDDCDSSGTNRQLSLFGFRVSTTANVYLLDRLDVCVIDVKQHTRFPVFVANRLEKIEEISIPSLWRFVNSGLNAADHVSRGLSASDFVQTSQWFAGQEFLNAPKEAWPVNL